MKNLIAACLLFFACNGISAQISGNTSPQSVTPATASVIDATITVGGTVNLTDATVQISNNYYASDVLAFDATLASSFGITGSYSTSSGVSGILTFTGTTTPANWQALLRTVTYRNTAASCGPSSRTIVFNQGNFLFNSFSEHYYQYINASLNWVDAKAAAAARSYNGMQGYLATITSAGENNFVWKLLGADAWIGGSYDYQQINAATGTTTYANQTAALGNAYWVTGPEAGTPFSSGLASPVAKNGAYMNWNAGEPNNAGNEYYVEFYSSGATGGKWNDLGIGSKLPYVVEYGGLPGDIQQNNSLTETLTIASTIGGDITGGNVTVCSGSNSTTLTSTAAVPGVTIVRWESSVDNFLTTATPIASTSATYTASNLTQTTYFRTIASGNSCSVSPSSVTKITVGSSVAGTLSADNLSVCNGSAANLSLTGNVGNVLKWQSSTDNVNWTDIDNTTALYTTPALPTGTYYYQAQVQSTGCVAIATTTPLTITATAGSASVGGTLDDSPLCTAPNTATLTLKDYTGLVQKWQSSTNGGATWTDIANTTATLTANNLALTTLYRARVKNGSCNVVSSSTGILTVNPAPVVAAIAGTASVCAGSTITLSDATSGGVWSSGSSSVATVDADGLVTGIAAGTSVISYTVTGGNCSTPVTKTVTVNALPVVAAITGTASVCVEASTTLADATPGGVWSSSDVNVATVNATGAVTGVADGSADIIYTVTNGSSCSVAVSQTVTVDALPAVLPITGTATVCKGLTTSLSDASSDGLWFSSNTLVATVDPSGLVTGVAAGTASITYTVHNGSGCNNATSLTVTVNDVPEVEAITGTVAVCINATTPLADATPDGVWSSDATSIATVDADGLVTGVTEGSAVISYTVSNGSGCTTAVTRAVTVNALPVVPAITGNGTTVLRGYTLALSNTTPGGAWSSENEAVATVDADGLVTGIAPGSATITYAVVNGSGCSSTTTIAIDCIEFVNTEAPAARDSVYYVGDPQNPATAIGQITALPGATLTFYTSATGGTASAAAPSLPTQPGMTVYWVSQTVNGSEGPRISFKVILATPDVFVPKVFTPNNDGINDIVRPVVPGLRNFRSFKIYNRWGNLVFMSTNPDAGWDGRYKGNPQPRETYLWMIEGEDLQGHLKRYSGMITLFR